MTRQNLRHPSDLSKHGPRLRLTPDPHEFINKRPLKAAAMEMGPGPIELEPKPDTWFWYTAPDIRPTPPDTVDLSGSKYGRLSVIGLLPAKGSGQRALWLTRCSCGLYEGRTGKAIRSAHYFGGLCHRCKRVLTNKASLWRQNFFDRNGYYPSDEDRDRLVASWV